MGSTRTVLLMCLAGTVAGCCGRSTDSPPAPAPATGVAPMTSAPPAAPAAVEYDPQYIAAHLGRMGAELGCGTPAQHATLGHFCLAVGWPSGTAEVFPPVARAFPGVTSWIPTTGPVPDALQQQRRFSVLAVRPAGPTSFADVVSPRASPGDMAPGMAVASVEQVLRQNSPGPIALHRGLYQFVVGRAASAQHPLARTASGWQYQGGSFADIRRVGNRWVVIEVPRNNPQGLYISIFVDNETVGVGL